jgi:hypothetical protein
VEDAITLLDRTIEEHRLIREHLENVAAVSNDVEAQVLLDWNRSSLAVSGPESIALAVGNLQKSISAMETRLQEHIKSEERDLPPVLGAGLMNILLTDHALIKSAIENINKELAKYAAPGISPDQILDKKMGLIVIATELIEMIGSHALKEDGIFRQKKKDLETARELALEKKPV